MMGIGFGEMILIAGIALVVIGPEKFPDFAKIMLRTIRDLRGYMDEVKHEVAKELRPVQKELQHLSRYDPETYLNALTDDEKKPPSTASANSPYDKTGVSHDTETAPAAYREPQPGEEYRAEQDDQSPAEEACDEESSEDIAPEHDDDDIDLDIPERLDG